MLKATVKLVVAACIANATWRMGSAYLADFQFRDSVREAAAFEAKTNGDLHQRIVEIAAQRDLPLSDDAFTIERHDDRVVVDGSYVQPIEFFPGYAYPWRFSWAIDAPIISGKPNGLNELKELVSGPSPDKP